MERFTVIMVEKGTAVGLIMSCSDPSDWMLKTVIFVTAVAIKYNKLSLYSSRPICDWRIWSALIFIIVRARMTMSKNTEEAKLIGAQETMGCIWQFDPNGVGGPVMAWYLVATAI